MEHSPEKNRRYAPALAELLPGSRSAITHRPGQNSALPRATFCLRLFLSSSSWPAPESATQQERATWPPAEEPEHALGLAGLPPGVPPFPSSCLDHGMSRKFLKARTCRLFYGIPVKGQRDIPWQTYGISRKHKVTGYPVSLYGISRRRTGYPVKTRDFP